MKDNLLQTSLAQERARWKKEEESVRSKAVEAAVAIAEVKWLEEEQKKISEAVEVAMQTARGTWQEEKKRDIGIKSLCKHLLWLIKLELIGLIRVTVGFHALAGSLWRFKVVLRCSCPCSCCPLLFSSRSVNDYGDWEIKGTLTKIMVGEEGEEDNVDPLKDSSNTDSYSNNARTWMVFLACFAYVWKI